MRTLVDPTDDPGVDDAHRRGRILWALATCMATKGYQATTIADIAAAARVSKTMVYAHFRDKEECLLELYSRANDTVLARVHEAQAEARTAGLPWRDRLRAGIGAYLGTLADGPAVAWAALVEVQAAGRPALALRRRIIDRYVDLITDLAAELAAQCPDEVRQVERPLVVAAVGGINELLLARVEQGAAEHLTEDVDAATAVVVGLLERR
ncbi:TetR/AcrR family transcriptional regulator [Blastococcus tunisiensis]|uniref:DNA-binding transcriptional regulator, AcrR family n=1 Tax=Blastococcus tunisiensis TaxID=1798228 RepID=A0A1I2L380_9ACTN|nr:TetR/AcrR family transcriptional regulator [Blastococcus sp. DSM 46838]SFF73665.1 DNA-binding transcriptional regulator, AcrR family [Blastococcus sp. DSM 46838]